MHITILLSCMSEVESFDTLGKQVQNHLRGSLLCKNACVRWPILSYKWSVYFSNSLDLCNLLQKRSWNMLKLLFSLEIVLLGVLSGIAILAPRYNTRIVRKSIVIRYNFNELLRLYNVVSNNSWMSGKQCIPWWDTTFSSGSTLFVQACQGKVKCSKV